MTNDCVLHGGNGLNICGVMTMVEMGDVNAAQQRQSARANTEVRLVARSLDK